MAMLTDYLAYSIAAFANPTTNSELENPVFGAPKQTKDGEAEAYWRMVNECGKYGYPTRARNELTSIANLAPQTRTSITKQLDTNTNIFQNPAVAERTSSTDITFSDIRGRWDRTANGGQGGFAEPPSTYPCRPRTPSAWAR